LYAPCMLRGALRFFIAISLLTYQKHTWSSQVGLLTVDVAYIFLQV